MLVRDAASTTSLERYYEARAAEYDQTSYEELRRAGGADLALLEELVWHLPAARTVDVACGTGWLTRLLRGDVVALDASESMLRRARERVPAMRFVRARVPPLPFADRAFDRVFTSHFYGHLDDGARTAFLEEAFRVAPELVVVEQAWRPGLAPESWEERTLRDGRSHLIFKRYFTAAGLAVELDGEILLSTPTFVAARARRRAP